MIEKGRSMGGPFRFFGLVPGGIDSAFLGFLGSITGLRGGELWRAGGSMVPIGLRVASFCGVRATLVGQTWVNLSCAIFQLTSWG